LERLAVNSLTLGQLWTTKEGTRQKPAIMQQMSNLTGLLAQHAAGRGDTERRDYVDALRNVGAALVAVATRPNDPALSDAGKKLTEVQTSMAAEEFTARADAAFNAIKAKFPNTKPAPTISPNAITEPEPEIIEEEEVAVPAPARGEATPAAAGGPRRAAPPPPARGGDAEAPEAP
jgi:hypothetical protein